MAMTAQEELDLTDAAIRSCLLAQEYALPGQQRKLMARYDSLTKRKDELEAKISAASEGSGSMCSLLQMGDAT